MSKTVDEIKKVLERYENSLVKAGFKIGDIDYDILSEERFARWKEIEEALTQYRKDTLQECMKIKTLLDNK